MTCAPHWVASPLPCLSSRLTRDRNSSAKPKRDLETDRVEEGFQSYPDQHRSRPSIAPFSAAAAVLHAAWFRHTGSTRVLQGYGISIASRYGSLPVMEPREAVLV